MWLKTFSVFLVMVGAAQAGSFETNVTRLYTDLVVAIEKCGLEGPISKEIARYACVRHALENGLDRPPTYSIPGISRGGWNEQLFIGVKNKLAVDPKITSTYDEEGVRLLVLQGESSELLAATTIAVLFDHYVARFSFSEQHRQAWKQSKQESYLLSSLPDSSDILDRYNRLASDREQIIKKANRIYGPKYWVVERQVTELIPLFIELEKKQQ